MPHKEKGGKMAGHTWRGTNLSLSDFATTDSEASTVSADDAPTEIFHAEIGDENGVDSQLASYDFIRLGRSMDSTTNSGKGKYKADFNDSGDAATVDNTEVRLVLRPRNHDEYLWTGVWHEIGDLERDDTRQRVPRPPLRNSDGEPRVFQDGRVLAIEFRNAGDDFEVSKANSNFRIPVNAGY